MTDPMKERWRRPAHALVLVGSIVLVVLSFIVGRDARVDAQVLTGVESSSAVEIAPEIYGRVQSIRKSVGLTAEDLATLDMNGEQAENVLRSLLTWTERNALRIESADRALEKAEYEQQETQRQINVGPRNERAIRDYPARVEAAAKAQQQRLALHQEAARQAMAGASRDQLNLWEAVNAPIDASGRTRSLSTFDQELSQDYLAAKRGETEQGRAVGEGGARENTRTRSLRLARTSRLPEVLSAEAKVLPVPKELATALQPDSIRQPGSE